MTFLSALRDSFDRHATRVAVEFPEGRLTYGELEHAALSAAALLQAAGIERGDRVILFLERKPAFLRAHLGALWAGAVPLPINPGSKAPELRYYARDSAAAGLVYDDATAGAVAGIATDVPLGARIHGDALVADGSRASYRACDPGPDDPALLLYSSGTTGEPKGVVHTQANLASAVAAIVRCWRFAPEDTLVNVLPLFHIHGLSFAAHVSLASGATMRIGDAFHPTGTLDLIDQATVFMGVPPYYYAFLKRPEFRAHARRWDALRLATCGSAPLRPELLPELEEMLGRPVINRYGMTECHVLTSLPLDGPWPHGSVGVPLEGIEIALRAESGAACAPGDVGRVYARGPNLFREYWRRPDATRASFDAGGWFDTGDLGRFDRDGFLSLVGRSHDLIIVGGFNVYPSVVERVLGECPGVRECAVVGVADETRGERVAAFVVPSDSALDPGRVRAFCRERLVDYQCPTRVVFVPSLPRNPLGKVLKRALRESLGT